MVFQHKHQTESDKYVFLRKATNYTGYGNSGLQAEIQLCKRFPYNWRVISFFKYPCATIEIEVFALPFQSNKGALLNTRLCQK